MNDETLQALRNALVYPLALLLSLWLDEPYTWVGLIYCAIVATLYVATRQGQSRAWAAAWLFATVVVVVGEVARTFLDWSTLALLPWQTAFFLLGFPLLHLVSDNNWRLWAWLALPAAVMHLQYSLARDLDYPAVTTLNLLLPLFYLMLVWWHGFRRVEPAGWRTLAFMTGFGLLLITGLNWPVAVGYIIFAIYLPLLWLPLWLPLLLGGWLAANAQGAPTWQRAIGLIASLLLVTGLLFVMLRTWGNGMATTEPINRGGRPILVDTDLSYDDYAALIYLLNDPSVEVVGITVVHGTGGIDRGIDNVQRLLHLTGRDAVPVAIGARQPRGIPRTAPASWKLVTDHIVRPALPSISTSVPETAGLTLIGSLTEQHPNLSIVALGPLTNVAAALTANPDLPQQLDELIIGAGAVTVEQPLPDGTRDLNLWLDPAANELVFAAGFEMTLIPLDLTHIALPFDQVQTDALRNIDNDAPDVQIIAQLAGAIQRTVGTFQIWDLVTTAIVVEPQICTTWRELPLGIQQEPIEEAGYVMVVSGEPNARVCLDGNPTLLQQTLVSGLRQ